MVFDAREARTQPAVVSLWPRLESPLPSHGHSGVYRLEKRHTGEKSKTRGQTYLSLQLILNAIWSPLFFGMQNPLLGLIDVSLIWLTIVWTIVAFWKVSKSAAWLLLPYLLWTTFAAYLNFAIFFLNR